MSLAGHLLDPLSLNPKSQWLAFTSRFPHWSSHSQIDLANVSSREILSLASKFLLIPTFTTIIADAFRPLLLDLCARWLESSDALEDKLSALCFLLQPHAEIFPVLSAFLQECVLKTGPLAAIFESVPPEVVAPSRLHRVLLAYYRILMANPELPSLLDWPLGYLSRLFWAPHPDSGVRYLAIRCYALQSGMSEAEREKLENTIIGSMAHVDCPLEFGLDVQGRVNIIDGWLLPVIETQRIHDARNAIVADTRGFSMGQGGDSILLSDLSPLVTSIHGVLMLRHRTTIATPATPLVPTNTTFNALRALALQVSLRLPVLLTSPPSSGKTLILSHLASTLYPAVNNQLITINLADTSIDARSLLGSYVHSARSPGTFEWREGVLVQAMRTGRWVILKGIDKGSNEVLGILKPLVESLGMGKWIGGRAKLDVPNRGEVVAAESFAIFATRSPSISGDGHFSSPMFFGAQKFYEVIVSAPTDEELRIIIAASFPKLSGPAAWGITTLWDAIKAVGSTATDREISLRDLRRYCSRLDALLPALYRPLDVDTSHKQVGVLVSVFPNPTLREEMFLEARDIFFGAASLTSASRTRATALATIVAVHLGLTQEKCDWLLSQHAPEVVNEVDPNGHTTALRLGRIRLSVSTSKSDIIPPPTRPFAMHRPAVTLMSRIATCISTGEPVLLTGETGTGKTSVITHLASLLHRPLISVNLSQQTESSDLLGSFKPIDARIPGSELQLQFLDLFRSTFSQKRNVKFEESTWKAVNEGKWKRAAGLWKESLRLAKDRIRGKLSEPTGSDNLDSETPRKRRRTDEVHFQESERNWLAFEQAVLQFEAQYITKKGKFAFGFVEGPLVKALRSGDWILLDEINLASQETLEALSTLLRDPISSITLTENGSMEPVPRHPDFRIFACMNPATDAGKKELPPNIRTYFTEMEVPPPDADRETLLAIINQYIGPSAVSDKAAIMDIAEFYAAVKALSADRRIADGSNRRPYFSMRTLARALTFAAEIASAYSLRRALWEGCLMAFTMTLDVPSAGLVTSLAQKHILNGVRNVRLLLMREPAPPQSRPVGDFIKFGPFYLEKGDLAELPTDDYIMTPSVERKLIDLARIISTRMFPVLIEGPTSSGKTSTVEFLAKRTGHRFVRINNHEHTDIQEYLGTYVSDPVSGKLVFKDGLLVQALRQGDWIVLDELNLAPTDVLEALNRLLDDNRELFIPETQEVIRPHPHFMLFATQNPPGLYAGRKVLSRAFRSRFLEVHFEDVPQAELETILCQRCRIAPSYAQRIVAVFRELQKRRQTSRVFESKQGFATLRDLFRWAGRDAVGYQELAENGYMLLAERARREDDKAEVKSVIESIMKVRIDEATLYSFDRFGDDIRGFLDFQIPSLSNIVWTKAMQRLLVLVGRALRSKEPVLLVGETGSGKTSVCQVYADAVNKGLLSLNCHQNTETADLIGGLRPIRNKAALEAEAFGEASSLLLQCGVSAIPNDTTSLLSAIDQSEKSQLVDPSKAQEVRRKLRRTNGIFEWHDGPLIEAMKAGDVLLVDEISLADDSVLERLNSVLEPARTIVLAEKGGDNAEGSLVQAASSFQLIATMNPGGDYGKKELSPALRNRFTEIWVPPVNERVDLAQIIASSWRHESLKPYTYLVLDFIEWLGGRVSDPRLLGLRDIIAWVTFSNSMLDNTVMKMMSLNEIFHHAAHMACLDGLGSLPALSSYSLISLRKLKDDALSKLQELAPINLKGTSLHNPSHDEAQFVQLGAFALPRGPQEPAPHTYDIQAPTTRDNAMRLVRASQLSKPILLEGSPGVGKTSLVTTLANICGYHLCRINLSDQTDLADLFGADLPVDGGRPGEFAWKEAEFLRAMQEGHWVLLDEMNLAPQSVLEGLNAVLDHRGTVFVPELGRSFTRHPSFRIFAAQNPIQQGGGRKGLPKSYVNRFTKVFIDPLTPADLLQISKHMFPKYPEDWLQHMILYNSRLEEETSVKHSFGRNGSPWEFNLRDIFRWGVLLHGSDTPLHPVEHLRPVYLSRFRTDSDRESARTLFDSVFNLSSNILSSAPYPSVSPSSVQVGHFVESRKKSFKSSSRPGVILQAHLPWIEAVGVALQRGWLVIVSGPPNSGKTSLVRVMAELTGNTLQEISVNHATDTTDILGSYEQVDSNFCALSLVRRALQLAENVSRTFSGSKSHTLSNFGRLRTAVATPSPIESLSDLLQTTLITLEGLADLDDNSLRERIDLQERLHTELAASKVAGHFTWVDGPLVRALKEGHWLLLDNANLCSPSVLDRLNSLCEPSGVLTLNERGPVDGITPVITPHPNFRLIMCVDPQYGELSRAMRNRGIEISLSLLRTQEDKRRLQDFHFLPSSPRHSDAGYISALDFELVRRCLESVLSTAGSATWPPATALVGDSSASAVVDRVALILPRHIPTFRPPPLAVLNFFVRSMVPAYASHLSRCISGLGSSDRTGPLRNLHLVLDETGGPKLQRIRESMLPAPSILGPFQPMDSFMKSTIGTSLFTDSGHLTVQGTILRIYELFVRTTCDDFWEPPLLHLNARDDNKTDGLSREILIHLDEFTKTINEHGADLLRETSGHFTQDLSAEVQLIIDLLKYTAFLRRQPHKSVNFSLLQAVTSWIQEALRLTPIHLPDVKSSGEVLSRAVASTSGFGLNDIWSSWRGSISPNSYSPELEHAISDASDSGSGHKVRLQQLELIATRCLGTGTTSANPNVEDVAISYVQCVSDRTGVFKLEGPRTNKVSIIKELGILAYMPNGDSLPRLAQIMDLTCSDCRMSLQRFISYRHGAWAAESGKASNAGIILSAFASWLQALWDHGDLGGPSILFRPTELSTTIHACDWYGVTLESVSVYQKTLEHHSRLFTVTGSRGSTRIEDLTTLYRKTLLLLASSFHESFDEPTLKDLQEAYHGSYSFSELLSLLRHSSHVWLTSSVDRFLGGPVAQIGSDESRPATLRTLGHSWIALSRFFFDLYIPDIPLDPAALQNSKSEFWSTELASLSHELELETNLERRVTGNISNGTINYLDEQIRHVQERLDNLPNQPLKTARDLFRLREFWSEISQFMLKIVSESRVNQLARAFHAKSPEASATEHVIQESIARFYQRLESVYPEFDDISRPLRSALLYLRLGIRLMAHASTYEEAAAIENLSQALTAFPSVGGATALIATDIRGDIRPAEWSPPQSISLVLTAIAFEVELGINVQSRIAAIENAYERAVRLWLIDQKKREEADVAAQSLYRTNRIAHVAISESKLEEEEFLTLFPDYEALLDPDQGQERGPGSTARQSIPSDGSYPNSLMLLHLGIMTPGSYPLNALTRLSNLRATLLTLILDKHQNSLPEALDERGFPHQLTLLVARLRDLNHPDTSKAARPYNFYTDPHVPEIRRAATLVESLKLGLDILIREWPDQMVLQHLRDRCAQILALSAQSPVAKALALLEQLLLQTDDWEMYASQENTLKKHRHAITELIVSWRRLELSSWRGLLRTQAIAFEEGVSEWWFRLHNAIVRGLLEIVDRSHSEDMDKYLDQLVPLLDGFLKLSPLGQFSRRLDLLRSFGPFLEYLTLTKSEQARGPLRRVQRIVYSVQAYYSQFVSSITSSLALQERGVEAEIQSLIKIASWKDVNVQALRASAKKTHHQLYRLVRKYRDVMRQPVNDLLQPEQGSDPGVLIETSAAQSPLIHNIVDSSSLHIHVILVDGPAHLRDLSKTYRKFDSLVTTRIDNFVKTLPSHDLDDLAEQIRSTAKELASVPVSTGATAERREKLWKALLVRKRKAWSDFVKELKRIGLATNVQSTVLHRQMNDRWLREQPFPVIEDGNFPGVRSSEQIFFRLQGLLPRLRATLVDHHGDISTQELQRSIMLLESALSISLSCRSKLAVNLNEYKRLKHLSRRLSSIRRSSEISAWGPSVSDTVLNIEDTLNRMCHAISETIHKVNEFGDLPGAPPAPAALLEGLQTLLSSTKDRRDALRLVGRNLKEAEPPILLRDEHDTVASAQGHVTKSQDLLLEWAQSQPQFRLIILPLRGWLASQRLGTLCRNPIPSASDPGADQVIEALLTSIQSVLSIIPAGDQSPTLSQDNYLKDTSWSLIKIGDLLRVDSKVALLNSLVERLAGCPSEEVKRSTSRLLPFLQRYMLLVEEQLAGIARWVHSLFKLEFAACSVMLNIATNGFCKPPDASEQGEAGTEDGTSAGGVGIGEGTGNQNMNKEIEDESQIEGLKDESGGDGERDEGEENGDDAIEVSDDFQGGLENIPDGGFEEEETPTDEDPEETLGNLDVGDPDTIDEKLWGDETGPRDDDQLGRANEDHSTKPSAHSEVVAKENEPPKNDQVSQETKNDGAGDKSNDADSNEAMAEDQVDEDNGDAAHGEDGAALDDFVQDADILDLPDDLEMDEGTKQQDLGEEMDDDMLDDDWRQPEISPEPSPHPIDENADGESLNGQRQEGGDAEPELEDPCEDQDVSMRPDVLTGDGTCTEAVPDGATNSDVHEDTLESQSGGARGTRVTSESEEARRDDAVHDEQVESTTAENRDGGSANASTRAGTLPSHETVPHKIPLDHSRSLGDAFKEAIKNPDDIFESDSAPTEPAMADLETPFLQYLHDDDADHDMQALGPAGAEEAARLSDLHLADDTDGPNSTNQMNVDEQDHQAPQLEVTPSFSLPSESPQWALQEDIPRALSQHEVQSQRPTQGAGIPTEPDVPKVKADNKAPEAEYVELALRQWQAEGQPSEGAQNLWRLYESLTQALSYALCEQLRLILEPTLATRLKGDYRTGKRLNMKKIIPYIASEYTKDKIWLRRTRPSQREYQVFLVLDDSRSMAESHSIHLAFETLALVSKALNRLEVGEIGIAKFGETVDVLHRFDDGPLTDQAAVHVMSAFTFNQKATNVLSLVETSLRILEAARESRSTTSSSIADLWQLEIIISDGLCQDHEKLRAVLRRAQEQRIMMVFVIVDSLQPNVASSKAGSEAGGMSASQNSILSMNQVSYKNIDGRMELQMQRYLDTFPFDYYVVLRDVEALPEVLSGTLKQFFERVSESDV